MKLESAAAAKGTKGLRSQSRPREGTKTRALYDLFYAHKGELILISAASNGGSDTRLSQLIDVYGLDIRNIKAGCWILAGEWFGRKYVDYIAQKMEQKK